VLADVVAERLLDLGVDRLVEIQFFRHGSPGNATSIE